MPHADSHERDRVAWLRIVRVVFAKYVTVRHSIAVVGIGRDEDRAEVAKAVANLADAGVCEYIH